MTDTEPHDVDAPWRPLVLRRGEPLGLPAGFAVELHGARQSATDVMRLPATPGAQVCAILLSQNLA